MPEVVTSGSKNVGDGQPQMMSVQSYVRAHPSASSQIDSVVTQGNTHVSNEVLHYA